MKTSHSLLNLYNITVRKYRKLKKRLKKYTIANGSAYQKHIVIEQLLKLKRKLHDLQFQLKIAACAGIITLSLQSSPVKAQSVPGPFVLSNRANNPLREAIVTYYPSPAVADVDNDGDPDVAVGRYNGAGNSYFQYFQNNGSNTLPVLQEIEDPFNGAVNVNASASAPAFADIDEDGDMDLFIGQNARFVTYGASDSTIQYFRNDNGAFAEQTGPWNPTTKEGNPFHGLKWNKNVNPCFVDLDQDGDTDAVIGTTYDAPAYQALYYYVNDGEGNFSEQTISASPPVTGTFITPAFADLDGDGDLDMALGSENPFASDPLKFYRQTSPGNFIGESGTWDANNKTGNPFNDIAVEEYSVPVFADFDGDGDQDLLVGHENYNDIISYYENTGNSVFIEKIGLESPFGGIDVGDNASPILIDVDGDTDLDAVVGNKYTTSQRIYYYRNEEGIFNLIGDEDEIDPFENVTTPGYYAYVKPVFENLNNNDSLEMIIGDFYGTILYYESVNGVYEERPVENPFEGIDINALTVPCLIDIDNDQDKDLFLGAGGNFNNQYSTIYFYENTGSATNPQFTERTGSDNPLSSFTFYGYTLMNFTDIDHDGDTDIFINSLNPQDIEDFIVRYFENTGTPENPVFTEVFDEVLEGTSSVAAPFFVDFDNDGDSDAFIGSGDGTVQYYINENPPPTVTFNSSATDYEGGSLFIDAELTVDDSDSDLVVRATITIQNFTAGQEELTFTPQSGITGSFDTDNGILTLTGKATLTAYQAVLRTVAYSYSGESSGERNMPGERVRDFTKAISIAVYDTDFTNPVAATRNLNVTELQPPPTEPPVTPPLEPPGELIIYNAVAPNSTGDNKFMRLLNIPAGNKVSIFNRWGDKVFEVSEYDNNTPGRRFEGSNEDGNALPSGTYFYKIEFIDGRKTLTGYLSLKQ